MIKEIMKKGKRYAKEIEVNYKYDEIIFHNTFCSIQDTLKWKEYRKKWHEIPEKRIISDYPMHLDIEITTACNLKCIMCPRTQILKLGKPYEVKFMELNVFNKIIDQSKDRGLFAINLNASGEPLINKDIVEMIRYAKKNNILDVMFHTNGTLLNSNISRHIIESGLNKLIISLDSPIKTQYESIRKGANFDEVVLNIKEFVRLRNKMGKDIPHVRINMVLMKENYKQKDVMVDLWKNEVDSIGFLQYINFFNMDDEDRNIEDSKGIYDENFICEKLWQRLAISEEGRIKLCHMDDEGRIFLGHIARDNLADIWKGKEMSQYRKLHVEGKIKDIPMCSICGVPVS